jgi:hypothetical protein
VIPKQTARQARLPSSVFPKILMRPADFPTIAATVSPTIRKQRARTAIGFGKRWIDRRHAMRRYVEPSSDASSWLRRSSPKKWRNRFRVRGWLRRNTSIAKERMTEARSARSQSRCHASGLT